MIRKFLFFFLITYSIAAEDNSFKNFETPIDGMLPYFVKKDLSPTWKKENKELLKLGDHQVQSQLTKTFGSKKMKGKVTIVNFFFATCPGYCPRITSNVKKVFNDYRDNNDVQFVSYSVTPSLDTLEVLKNYAEKHEVNNKNWHFVRGKREVIYDVARKYLLADLAIDLNKEKEEFVHTESLYLIDGELNVRGIYNSASMRALQELKGDIKLLLK